MTPQSYFSRFLIHHNKTIIPGVCSIATKALPSAAERIVALKNLGFIRSEEKLIGHDGTKYDSYFPHKSFSIVLEKPVINRLFHSAFRCIIEIISATIITIKKVFPVRTKDAAIDRDEKTKFTEEDQNGGCL